MLLQLCNVKRGTGSHGRSLPSSFENRCPGTGWRGQGDRQAKIQNIVGAPSHSLHTAIAMNPQTSANTPSSQLVESYIWKPTHDGRLEQGRPWALVVA